MIDLLKISLQFNGRYLFNNVNLKINSGDRICLVGSNGSGKSSLLNIINGSLEPETGTVQKAKHISVGYLPQDQIVHSEQKLLQEANSALTKISELQLREQELISSLSNPTISDEEREDEVNQLGEIQHQLEVLESYSASYKVEKILMGLGFVKEDLIRYTNEFSGGWQMRIALAKILISSNDILLLDEPTNHLDLDSLEWLVQFIKSYKGALIIVSHDRWFINKTTNKTIEIFNGSVDTFNGDFDAYLRYKQERDEQQVHMREQQEKKIKETKKFIERFRYKNTKAKQVQSRVKQLEKIDLADIPLKEDEINIEFPAPPRSGVCNVELNSVCKSFGNIIVLNEVDFRVNRGEKIAFVGPNGTGKTTLGKIIAGNLDFQSGERVLGHNTVIAYYSQDVADNLNPNLDILESVDGIAPDKSLTQLRTLLGAFLFKGDDVFKKVGVLSGGEKSRLALAMILLTKSNFIILDEPTNHLDFNSKKVLQNALIHFTGSLILVSHDIDFLTPIVSKISELENGKLKNFNGGIEYYLIKKEELYAKDSQPKQEVEKDLESRKELKRLQAERRQEKYNATKQLRITLENLEKEIQKLEDEYNSTEQDLLNPNVYNDSVHARNLNEQYVYLKTEIDKKMKSWEKLSQELISIEQKYS
jgi:ATP-binding cassette subfamily F protein 3